MINFTPNRGFYLYLFDKLYKIFYYNTSFYHFMKSKTTARFIWRKIDIHIFIQTELIENYSHGIHINDSQQNKSKLGFSKNCGKIKGLGIFERVQLLERGNLMERQETLYVVIPCYNEEAVLPVTEKRLTEKLQKMIDQGSISKESRVVFVDDGSKDNTWSMISEMYKSNPYVMGIKSSRNRGHQNTLLEGMMTVKDDCDMMVSMDADLQDDIEVLDQFVEKYYAGCDIVYGVRSARKTDTWFKRTTAQSFYKIMESMGVNIVYNHADYRLMSKRALKELENFKEVNLFLRGIIPMIGFRTDTVEYERNQRFAGESKYPLKKMISFALDGITSLSIKPIRFITSLGICLFIISIILLVYYGIGYFRGQTIHGWVTLVISIWGIGGLELLGIGIIGEYIGKIYLETKGRPRFIVEEYLKK